MALALLSRTGDGIIRVRYLADRCGIPGPYLSKIIHTLARHGLVGTRRGVGGGVWLMVRPDEITLLELCRTLDDPVLDRSCPLGLPPCVHGGACVEPAFCHPQRDRLAAFLRDTTVAEFAEKLFGPPGDTAPHPAGTTAPTPPRVIRTDQFNKDKPKRG